MTFGEGFILQGMGEEACIQKEPFHEANQVIEAGIGYMKGGREKIPDGGLISGS